jgi:hypothetical protein
LDLFLIQRPFNDDCRVLTQPVAPRPVDPWLGFICGVRKGKFFLSWGGHWQRRDIKKSQKNLLWVLYFWFSLKHTMIVRFLATNQIK